MRRYLIIAALAITAAASVTTAAMASSRPVGATAETLAVRHAYTELATASERGPATTVCALLSASDAKKYLQADFPSAHTCLAAAKKYVANWNVATLRREGREGACALAQVKVFKKVLAQGLTYLRYRVLSSTEVRLESAPENVDFEGPAIELWKKINGRWIVEGGFPPLFEVQC